MRPSTDRPRAHAHGMVKFPPGGGGDVSGCAWEMSSACYTASSPKLPTSQRASLTGRTGDGADLLISSLFHLGRWPSRPGLAGHSPSMLSTAKLRASHAKGGPPTWPAICHGTPPRSFHRHLPCRRSGPPGETGQASTRRSRARPAERLCRLPLSAPPPNQRPRVTMGFFFGWFLVRPHRT